MPEYIEKEAFKERYSCCGYLPEMSEKGFDAFPAADVAPVVHGKWIKITTTGTDMFGEPTEVVIACNCSVCGLDGREETDFCPHCGARMDGEFD